MRVALFLIAFTVCVAANAQNVTPCEGGSASIYACSDVDLYARLPLSTFNASAGNDVWGWTDPQTGAEYALVGLDNGTAFVDITIPEDPVYLGKLPTATDASIWRDVKVFANYAFVVSEADGHGMQVFDLERLRNVSSPPQTFTADGRYTGVGSAHNVVIDERVGFAYIVGANEPGFSCNGGGLHIVDLSSPEDPSFAGCFDDDGYTHDAQCIPYEGPDNDHIGEEICVLAQGRSESDLGDDHISIVNVTDKSNPTLISTVQYPDAGYAHQGWLTEDLRYFVANDELDLFASPTTRTIIFNVADLDNPEFDFFYFGPIASRDHNLYIDGRYAYLSNYAGGLRIVDLTAIDSGTLTEVGFLDTYPPNDEYNFSGQWSNYPFFASGTVIANDQSRGLFVLRPTIVPTASEPNVTQGSPFILSNPVPNPSRSGAVLQLTTERTQAIRAHVLDLAGRHVATLHDGLISAQSPLSLRFDGTSLATGLYLVRVVGEDFTATRRLSLVR